MRRVILAIVATAAALVLLLSFRTHPQPAGPGASPAAAAGGPAPGGAGTGTAGNPAAGRAVTGAAWPTIYGPVQVRITVAGGKVTSASAVEYPTNTVLDQQINASAIPRLNREALAAGSAKVDTVSGATYTSGGYIASLQSALDKAGA